jgi:hypothetical protein
MASRPEGKSAAAAGTTTATTTASLDALQCVHDIRETHACNTRVQRMTYPQGMRGTHDTCVVRMRAHNDSDGNQISSVTQLLQTYLLRRG